MVVAVNSLVGKHVMSGAHTILPMQKENIYLVVQQDALLTLLKH